MKTKRSLASELAFTYNIWNSYSEILILFLVLGKLLIFRINGL